MSGSGSQGLATGFQVQVTTQSCQGKELTVVLLDFVISHSETDIAKVPNVHLFLHLCGFNDLSF